MSFNFNMSLDKTNKSIKISNLFSEVLKIDDLIP